MDYHIHCLDVKNTQQNYIWLLEHRPSQQVIAIDPTESHLVDQFCQQHQLQLTQIWITHWHKDHIGGIPQLCLKYPALRIYGPAAEHAKIPHLTHPLHDLDVIYLPDLEIKIMAVPGHTLGHIVYYLPSLNSVFCGDTLFAMGCGRVFEGTFTQMYQSLQRLAALPAQTQVYCTHEYSFANAEFARYVDADNVDLQQRYLFIQQQHVQQQCTLPSSIAFELKTNPFLRAKNVAEFQHLRELKDQF